LAALIGDEINRRIGRMDGGRGAIGAALDVERAVPSALMVRPTISMISLSTWMYSSKLTGPAICTVTGLIGAPA